MIRPCGLLLVVPHLFAVPVSVLWVGLQKSTLLNLDVKNIFILSTAGGALTLFQDSSKALKAVLFFQGPRSLPVDSLDSTDDTHPRFLVQGQKLSIGGDAVSQRSASAHVC